MDIPPDSVLFDFDTDQCAMWDSERAAKLLDDEPTLYRSHLTLATGLVRWAQLLEERRSVGLPKDFSKGYHEALLTLAALLRQGDFLPGGRMVHLFDPASDVDLSALIEQWRMQGDGDAS